MSFLVEYGEILYPQFSSVTQSCPTLCDPMNRSTPSLPVHHQLPEFTQTHVHRVLTVMPSSHLILHHPLLLLPPIPPSIRVFSNESTLRMSIKVVNISRELTMIWTLCFTCKESTTSPISKKSRQELREASNLLLVSSLRS